MTKLLSVLVVLVMLSVPFICLASAIGAAPVHTAADAASPVTAQSGAADWSSAVMVLMAAAGVAWVVVSLNLRGRFGRSSNQTGGDADYQRRFLQPVETDPLWQAAHTNMAASGEMSPIPSRLRMGRKWLHFDPSPTASASQKTPIAGKPHAARGEKAGEK